MSGHQEKTPATAWVPAGIDTAVPSMARAYDYLLGGGHNFASDRQLATQAEQVMPGAAQIARLNRAFLGRAVRFLVDSGIRQFLDIGSGIPTVGNVHEIAQDAAPECRVLYVDKDPVAVAHSQLLLEHNDNADVLREDLRNPDAILGSEQAQALLRFDEPIAVLMVMMLHWVPDRDGPFELVARYRDAMPRGSYLTISHVTADHRRDQIDRATEMIDEARSADHLTSRSHQEVSRFFDGMDLVPPGLVGCGLWRGTGAGDFADNPELNTHIYAGVGHKA